MTLSRARIIIITSLVVILAGGLAAGIFLVGRKTSQSTETSAAEPSRPNAFATIPPFPKERSNQLPQKQSPSPKNNPDYNGDGRVDSGDESLFMQKYQSKDPSADLDNSGSVNVLDLNIFKQLLSQ